MLTTWFMPTPSLLSESRMRSNVVRTSCSNVTLPLSGDNRTPTWPAMKIQELIDPLKDAVYGAGEPTGEAHGRMKAAMQAAGILRSATVRPPTKEPSKEELIEIQAAVKAAGLMPRAAA